MNKPYELTEEEYKDIPCPLSMSCSDCPDNLYGNDYCGYEVRVAHAAQKKLLEYLVKKDWLIHCFSTDRNADTTDKLLAYFGIGELNEQR